MFFIAKYKPFEDKSDNITELLNELTCLIVFCSLTTNVASSSDVDTQFDLGFGVIGVILINTLINFFMFFKVNSVQVYRIIKSFL